MVNRKELDPEGGPVAAFGARLRSLRDARGWTQDELAERIGCTGSHISAVETGRRPPTRQFAKSADSVFGTGDQFVRRSLSVQKTALLEGFEEYLAHEARAVEVRLYEIGIISGLLQTPEYAKVLAGAAVQRGAITPEQADERVSVLMERQTALARGRAPMMFVVMDESCIRRQVGGPSVMTEQLDRLVEFASLPTTLFQIVSFDIGERRPFNLPVNLVTLPSLSVVAYTESQTQGHLERDTSAVLPLLTAYHQLQAASLTEAASVAMINEARKGTP
ncbi:helix-turn-helix domain-containing protein [Streptomyces sp. NPDC056500]|uniref:helix-turn-helix domain-containing protein n=1 Tax=Streptomyces sp. NPDC056500 TaxID=3345840 RepID=UPI0036C8E82F